MGKLLVVDGCLRAPETSRTKRLAEHFLAALCAACPGLEREDKRLIDMPLHPYAGEELEAREALSRLGRTDDPIFAEARAFAAADVIAVAAPFWDLGLPALVKVYIETVCAPGITFSYRPDGPRCRGFAAGVYHHPRRDLRAGRTGLAGDGKPVPAGALRHVGDSAVRLPVCRGAGHREKRRRSASEGSVRAGGRAGENLPKTGLTNGTAGFILYLYGKGLDGKKPRTGHSPERTPADCPPLKGIPVQPRGGPPRSPP